MKTSLKKSRLAKQLEQEKERARRIRHAIVCESGGVSKPYPCPSCEPQGAQK